MTSFATRPDPPTKRRGFVFSVAAAVMLNGLAIGAFAAAVTRWQVPSGAPSQAAWVTTFTVARPTPELAATAPPAGAMPAPKSAAVAAAPPPRLTAVAATKTPLQALDGASVVRFYRSSEVDRPAEPDSDWNLDTAVLDVAGVERLVFEVFIGRNGEVVACTILEPVALDSQARQTIEDRLRQTALQPAVLGGAAVASVRRIEVSATPPSR